MRHRVTVEEIDAATEAAFASEIADAVRAAPADDASAVELDLSHVSFMGSNGVRVLAAACDDLARHGRALRVHGASAPVRRVIEVSGMADLLDADDVPSE